MKRLIAFGAAAEMAPAKGPALEELARAYFARQNFIAIRSVSIRFEEEEVTDIDVWLYGRQGAGTRTRSIVDVKQKRSPKAFERVLWTRGMQLALGCDRAIVATTDDSPKAARFAHQQKVALLPAGFLRRAQQGQDSTSRLTLEEFIDHVKAYPAHKQDGDWLKRIADAKSAVVSLQPYPAFNKAIAAFRFFAERAATRPQHREHALRAAFLTASLACIALDAAMERLFFEEPPTRYRLMTSGITYGDAGDARVKTSIDMVLDVISRGVKNGRVIASQANQALGELFDSVRADMIAEFFAKDQNAATLFPVARELEARAHLRDRAEMMALSVEAKSIVGLFADFVQVKRPALLSADFAVPQADSPAAAEEKVKPSPSTPAASPKPTDAAGTDSDPADRKLL